MLVVTALFTNDTNYFHQQAFYFFTSSAWHTQYLKTKLEGNYVLFIYFC